MQRRRTGWAKRILVVLGIAYSGLAAAQYVWLDEKGVKQYSDRPPPPSVPNNRILKPAPKATAPAIALPASTRSGADAAPETPASPASPATASAQPTIAERNAEFNKRREERTKQEKERAEQERLAQQKAANCERAANYKRNLESGVRITTTDKNGEQSFMSDEQRARELREATKMLEGCA